MGLKENEEVGEEVKVGNFGERKDNGVRRKVEAVVMGGFECVSARVTSEDSVKCVGVTGEREEWWKWIRLGRDAHAMQVLQVLQIW